MQFHDLLNSPMLLCNASIKSFDFSNKLSISFFRASVFETSSIVFTFSVFLDFKAILVYVPPSSFGFLNENPSFSRIARNFARLSGSSNGPTSTWK